MTTSTVENDGESPFRQPDVLVVDLDLLWEVEVANAAGSSSPTIVAEQLGSVRAALDRLHPDHPAVLVVGPTSLADFADVGPDSGDPLADPERLTDLIETHPNLGVILVASGEIRGSAERLQVLAADTSVAEVVDTAIALLVTLREHHTPPAHFGRATSDEARIVMVTAAKGGEGATTVALNLATALAASRPEHRVALVDAHHNFGDVALALGLEPGPLHPDEAALAVPITRLATLRRQHAPSGLLVFVPPRTDDPFSVLPASTLLAICTHLRHEVDVIVIDIPAVTLATTPLRTAADLVLLVARPSMSSAKNAAILTDHLRTIGNLRVVLNEVSSSRVLRRTKGADAEQVEAALRREVIAEIPDADELDDRAEVSRLAFVDHPKSDAAQAFGRLASEVTHLAQLSAAPNPAT